MTEPSQQDQGNDPISYIATIPAIAIGAYAGMAGIVPLVIIAAAWWAISKIQPEARREWAPAVAIHAGYTVWFIAAIVITGDLDLTLVDAVITLAGAAWLFFRPGAAAMITLSLYHLAGLGYHGYQFYTGPIEFGTALHKALTMHVVIRILAIATMGYAWYKDHKKKEAGESPEMADTEQQNP